MKKENNKENVRITSSDASHHDIVKERLMFSTKTKEEIVLSKFKSGENGLSSKNVLYNRDKYGSNKITYTDKKSLLKRIVISFVNPFTAILAVLALVSFITDIALPIYKGNMEDFDVLTVVIILTMVIFSGTLRFIQETRSGNAAKKLLEMVKVTTSVERLEEGIAEIPFEEVVVGDIVHLAAGDMIPADLRIIKAKDLFISQASLTGESNPVEKTSDVSIKDKDSVTEYDNLAFMGTNVISGSAVGVVIVPGDDTLFGSIAKSVSKEKVVTGFEKGVNSVSWVLIRFMLVMVPVVLFINGMTKGDWKEASLFAISVAVGLTPEMLPMIVTTCLAKGAVAMSKKKTIVKNLNSIQNFGAIDILCTDKTGTITEDKVILEYHLNIDGAEDDRVLRHAFLNSNYQTGLKNLMDFAIIESVNNSENSIKKDDLINEYTKVDEIPFDFSRRRMSVVVEDSVGKTQMITKGAVEEILDICSHVEHNDKVVKLTDDLKNLISKKVASLNDTGMRVLGLAQKTNPSPIGAFSVADEQDMVLIGYLAFLDPPKETTLKAIKALEEYGVSTKIVTGDNDRVTLSICKKIGLKVDNVLLGSDIEELSDDELLIAAVKTNIFAKLSPKQKSRVVESLRASGHTVGFMGDGINDAPAMKAADVGISVDTAVDIAKESADIILLEKDLMVLEEGIIEGRKTYANMIKYIKMTASSNFGNMFSVLVASAFLPFLPMMSIQLILLNLIYDISCAAIPWDNVDKEFLKIPRKWDASSVSKFMLWIGPTSSVFDITTYFLMYFVICPQFVSNGLLFHEIPSTDTATLAAYIAVFQAGWFVESMWSQTLVIHMIRTAKIPFIQSIASFPVVALTFTGIGILTIIPFTAFGEMIGLGTLPPVYFAYLALTIFLYMVLVTVIKKIYIKKYNEFL